MLYTYEIDTYEKKISINTLNYKDYPAESTGYADFNLDGFHCVYAESLISVEDAKELVLNKCKELAHIFASCVKEIQGENQQK